VQSLPNFTFKIFNFGKYSFEKLTVLSFGSYVLDARASNTNGCLWSDTCVSSNRQNRLIWNKIGLFQLSALKWSLNYNDPVIWNHKGISSMSFIIVELHRDTQMCFRNS
jgi:hypothetical protein